MLPVQREFIVPTAKAWAWSLETTTATAGSTSTWRTIQRQTFFFTTREKVYSKRLDCWRASPSALTDSHWRGWERTWAISTEMDYSISSLQISTGRLTICIAISERDCSPMSPSKAASVKPRCPSSDLAHCFSITTTTPTSISQSSMAT